MSYMRVYYYENELEDEFSPASIKAKKIDADYDYNMAAKPWHYKDCRLAEYFWKYAKYTSSYGEIKEGLESYTCDEQADS